MNAAPPFAKHLASNDKKTRDKAVKALTTFLSDDAHEPIAKSDMDKLWKGIFYCFWMSDKPLVQQALATDLAELLLNISSTTSALAFLQCFWETIAREWNGIDRLRIDKYYMLVRRFVNATFRLLARAEWEKSMCDSHNDMLTRQGGPLCPTDIRVPTSLAYHVADIFLEELDKSLASAVSEPPAAPLATLLVPFFTLAAQTPSSTTYNRVQAEVFTPLFAALSSTDDDAPPDLKRSRLDLDTQNRKYHVLAVNACFEQPAEGKTAGVIVKKRLLRQIFMVASEPETRDSNRRKLYALFKEAEDDVGEEG
ncbi:nucleolar protein,Nop52-domain-containing protein [Mycena pura]|uniref:Nucleolar protein,Nop52-domain-containing protein n=1 Tax=Mycena pura TaxID=153505 RepID=A0AAD6YNY1_9AGAR|nr:nucleolar protein,Nop52-domain-containing protein [Mycena pura]